MRIERHQLPVSVVSAVRAEFEDRLSTQIRIMRTHAAGSREWRETAEVFLDYLGALSAGTPALDTPEARTILRNAALAAGGAVKCAAYAGYERFSVGIDYVNFGTIHELDENETASPVDPAAWTEAFCLVILAGQVDEFGESFDFTRTVGDDAAGDPSAELARGLLSQASGYIVDDRTASHPPSVQEQLAALDAALTRIRTRRATGGDRLPGHPHTVALQALRATVAGDREAFDSRLAALLLQHSATPGPGSRTSTLLALLPLALAALAYRAQSWTPGVESDYLPHSLVTGPEGSGRPLPR
ncbi:Imm49 family immunity protein [Kitasatospora sp. NPDC002551]|uniref:Imm49 family immunity protein n=1 Tax=unclassified Kitasatospora TaxID=2633591 RepID=UPI00331F8781